jgi:hypothetical protein
MDTESKDLLLTLFARELLEEDEKKHLIEQYKILNQSFDQLASRRQAVNQFFLSINTFLLAGCGFLAREWHQNGNPLVGKGCSEFYLLAVLGVIGTLLCANWHRLLKSYSRTNHGIWEIGKMMEKQLPAAVYGAQAKLFGEDFQSITTIECDTAKICMGFHASVVALVIAMPIAHFLFGWPPVNNMH